MAPAPVPAPAPAPAPVPIPARTDSSHRTPTPCATQDMTESVCSPLSCNAFCLVSCYQAPSPSYTRSLSPIWAAQPASRSKRALETNMRRYSRHLQTVPSQSLTRRGRGAPIIPFPEVERPALSHFAPNGNIFFAVGMQEPFPQPRLLASSRRRSGSKITVRVMVIGRSHRLRLHHRSRAYNLVDAVGCVVSDCF